MKYLAIILLFFCNINGFSQKTTKTTKVKLDVQDEGDSFKYIKIDLKFKFTYTPKGKKPIILSSNFNFKNYEFNIEMPANLSKKNVSVECANCDNKGFICKTDEVTLPDLTKKKIQSIGIIVKSNMTEVDYLQKKYNEEVKKNVALNKKTKALQQENSTLHQDISESNVQLAQTKKDIEKLKADVEKGKVSNAEFKKKYEEALNKLDTLQTAYDKLKEQIKALFNQLAQNEISIYQSYMKMVDCHCTSYDKKRNRLTFKYNVTSSKNDTLQYLVLGESETFSIEVKKSWKKEEVILSKANNIVTDTLDGDEKLFSFNSILIKQKNSIYNIKFYNSRKFLLGELNLKSIENDCKPIKVRHAEFNKNTLKVTQSIEVDERLTKIRIYDTTPDTPKADIVNIYVKDYTSDKSETVKLNYALSESGNEFNFRLPFDENILIVELATDPNGNGCSSRIRINDAQEFGLNPSLARKTSQGIKIKVKPEGRMD